MTHKPGEEMRLKSTAALRAELAKNGGLSQRGLAIQVGVHPSFINHLTAGRRKVCEPATAEKIAAALHVPVTDLFTPAKPTKKRSA